MNSSLATSKAADTHPDVLAVIRERWSPRAFTEEPVSAHDLAVILEAGRWAASSYNEQPWRFFVATKQDPEGYNRLLDLLVPMNQEWARSAPVLIITAGKRTFSHNGSPNRYGLHDTGAALANMLLQAAALGLHGHGMGGFDHQKARTVLGIPDDFEVGAALAIGHLGSPDQLNDRFRAGEEAPRTRKPLSEIAFGAGWGSPLAL